MSDQPPDLAAAAMYALPALVWAIVAADAWRYRLVSRPRSPLYRLLPLATTAMACLYTLWGLNCLFLPSRSPARAPRWFELSDVALVAGVALFRHVAWYVPLNAAPPGRAWLAATYGPAAVLALISVIPELVPLETMAARMAVSRLLLFPYVVGMLALSLRHLRRHARPGGWHPGGAAVARVPDLVVAILAVLGAAGLFLSLGRQGPPTVGYVQPSPVVNAGIGLLVAAPFAVRILGDVLRRLAFVAVVLVVTGAAYLGVYALRASPLALPLGFLLVAGLVLGLLAGQASLWSAIDRTLFRRGRRRRVELQGFLRTLSPETGALECCRRAAAEFVRILQLRGAAILLTGDRGAVVHGDIDAVPLRRVWQDGAIADGMPAGPFGSPTFRELPVPFQEALIASEVVAVAPIAGPRQRWGAAFVTAGPLGATFDRVDVQVIESLTHQFALVLDAAELVARVVAVERSLAQAEKLAAIGETAARIAHDIRNPVAAARSLAQQLAREPASPLNAEHADVILTELERVERQVAGLLRFARREECRLAPVDLGDLVRATVGRFGARLDGARVGLAMEAPAGIVVRADAEKIRQALINLIENALDALSEQPGPRRLAVGVSGAGGRAHVRVTDNGPGVPANALARLFEPFFSLKEGGTGLGLAIVRRTVEAHGGRIATESPDGGGATFDIALPLADGPPDDPAHG